MAGSQQEIYTIFCLIVGEDVPFPVKIANNETVGIFKDKIKEKRPDLFATIAAVKLKLHHVEILRGADLVKAANEKVSEKEPPLDPFDELADIFKGTPTKSTIHIIVEPPESVPMIPTHNPTRLPEQASPLTDEKMLKQLVGDFETQLRESINEYLRRDPQLPLWQPQSGTDTARSHIIGLGIPTLSVASNYPSLLLHNLGQPSHDPHLIGRVAKLFDSGTFPKFLCNTSGSGKTRLLFEGIWYRWSLYITARTLPEGVGSSDLEEVLRGLETRLTIVTEENRAAVLAANRERALRRSLQVLCARMIIFRVFLECASNMPSGITEEHKGRWLLMQVAPKTLISLPDPFYLLVQLFATAPVAYLNTSIAAQRLSINTLLGPSPPALFCVLDEAQVPTNLFLDYFLSDTDTTQRRPILREIILNWRVVIPNLILSGTGISMQTMEAVLHSVVAKVPGPKSETITDVGAFDNEKDQRAYLEAYLPPGYLDTELGKEVATRVGYWLHGRHRFTATFITRLLQSGLESPHHVLNEFVHDMTNFHPSDHEHDLLVGFEPEKPLSSDFSKLEKPLGFDFLKLNTDPALCRQFAGVVFDYIFSGQPRAIGGPDLEKLVENGFARFGGLQNIVADEPLALLAAIQYFNKKTAWTLRYFMVDGLTTANDSARGIAFEYFSAYILGQAFKTPRRLSGVFEFFGESDLKDETGRLVAIHKTDGGYVSAAVDIDSNSGPTYTFGRTCRNVDETKSWLKDPQRTVFCFPAPAVGPDLILILELSDGRLLRVLAQFKQKAEATMGPSATGNALRTTDPMQLMSRRDFPSSQPAPSPARGDEKRADNARLPELRKDLQDALRELGLGTNKAGDFSVLRVLVAHPAIPNKSTLADLANSDICNHPVATVDLVSLSKNYTEKQMLMTLQERVVSVAQKRKRKLEEHIEELHPKRRRD